jgi:hypothetical protein
MGNGSCKDVLMVKEATALSWQIGSEVAAVVLAGFVPGRAARGYSICLCWPYIPRYLALSGLASDCSQQSFPVGLKTT